MTDVAQATPTDLLAAAALNYAQRGWPVLALHGIEKTGGASTCSCGRTDCSSPGKHPRTANGLNDATTDLDQVRRWWRQWPAANIGLRTGVVFDVLDIDDPATAPAELATLGLDLDAVTGPQVITSKGSHHYVAATGEKNTAAGSWDWRGAGGYVVAPPSMHADGMAYRWADNRDRDEPLPEVSRPQRVTQRHVVAGPQSHPVATVDRYTETVMASALDAVRAAPEGRRNEQLNASSFSLGRCIAAGSLDRSSIEAQLLEAAIGAGLAESESVATIRSGLDSGSAEGPTIAHLDHLSPRERSRGTGHRERVPTPPETDGPVESRWLTLTPASSIEMDRARWVWEQRIPVGGTTLMAGREGLGKTMLACWLASRLTRGELPGEWHGKPGTVVYIGHEDDRSTVLVPRLAAAGADLDRFMFVDIPSGGTFSTSVDTDDLVKAATAGGHDVALIVIDPLDSHLGSVDSHKKSEVQSSVARLADAAQTLRCGALGLGHLNKGATTDVLSRVVGSVGFTTAVRSVLAVGERPDNPAERVCVLGKANMTDKASVPAIAFKAQPTTLDHPDGGLQIATACVEILEEIDGLDPNSILTGPQDREERSELDSAKEWLADVLELGPAAKKDLARWAREEGISERTLKRAGADLDVAIQRDENARGRPSTWALRDYGPSITGQTPLARNHDPADQGEHSNDPVTGQLPNVGPKPPERNPGELPPLDRQTMF